MHKLGYTDIKWSVMSVISNEMCKTEGHENRCNLGMDTVQLENPNFEYDMI